MSDDSQYIAVTDIGKFAALISQWHENRIKRLKHLMDVPEGTKIQWQNDDGPYKDMPQDLVIEGDLRTGVLIGLTMGLVEFGELPFSAVPDDEPEEEESE